MVSSSPALTSRRARSATTSFCFASTVVSSGLSSFATATVVHSTFGSTCLWLSMSTNGTSIACVAPLCPSEDNSIARERTHESAHAQRSAKSRSSPPPGNAPLAAIVRAFLASFPSVRAALNTASPICSSATSFRSHRPDVGESTAAGSASTYGFHVS